MDEVTSVFSGVCVCVPMEGEGEGVLDELEEYELGVLWLRLWMGM